MTQQVKSSNHPPKRDQSLLSHLPQRVEFEFPCTFLWLLFPCCLGHFFAFVFVFVEGFSLRGLLQMVSDLPIVVLPSCISRGSPQSIFIFLCPFFFSSISQMPSILLPVRRFFRCPCFSPFTSHCTHRKRSVGSVDGFVHGCVFPCLSVA